MAISFKPYYKSDNLIGEGTVKFRPYTGTKMTTLAAGTYKWKDYVSNYIRPGEMQMSFTSNSEVFVEMNFTGGEGGLIHYKKADGTSIFAYGDDQGWSATNIAYQTIILSSEQEVSQEFYDNYITTGALVKQATKTLEESTWAEIAQVSANKQWDAMGWKVGDTKTITLNGTVGTVALNNYQCKVYILGFDHNADKEGQGISFGMLEGLDGTQFCLTTEHENEITTAVSEFTMNTSDTTSGGWKNCKMRKTILGSTDVANGNATNAAITNPASGTLMSAFPAELRAVLKPITKYTNNVGQSTVASAISTTADYLPLLSQYEVFGEISGSYTANYNEKTNQKQYQYYVNGLSAIKRKYNDTDYIMKWWLRSPSQYNNSNFIVVNTDGTPYSQSATWSIGVAPIFLV